MAPAPAQSAGAAEELKLRPGGSASPSVAVVGGGLAGMAASVALTNAGFQVTLLERKPYLGGRASSYEHAGTGEIVDNRQHVLLGCCSNLLDFYRRTGAEPLIRWYDRLTFLEPGGRRSVIGASWWPAPCIVRLLFWALPHFPGATNSPSRVR